MILTSLTGYRIPPSMSVCTRCSSYQWAASIMRGPGSGRGRPDDEKKLSDFEAIKRYLRERFFKPANWIFKIERQGITHLKNIVISHYLLYISVKDKDGKKHKRVSRRARTWIKTKKGCKIQEGISTPNN